jgi:hypothetical protein
MPKWQKGNGAFITGDVIRWREAVWKNQPRGRRKPVKLGERRVTGEVKGDDAKGFLRVLVLKCEMLDSQFSGELKPLAEGGIIRRKPDTIRKGEPERLVWSDESARAVVASRFIGPEAARPPEAHARKERAPAGRKARASRKKPPALRP